jgi:hypothetical protein
MGNSGREYRTVATAALAALRRRWPVVVLALALNVGDVISTLIGFRLGVPEGNPLPRLLIGHWGELTFFSFKLWLVAAVIFVVCLLEARYPRLWRAVYVINAVLVAVVLSNSLHILARV